MPGGWRKINLNFLDWRWHHKPEYVSFAIHCILMANSRPKPFENIELQRGQFIISLRKFSETIGVSIRTLRTIIKNLTDCGFIEAKATHDFTIITLCNYEVYQAKEYRIDTPSTQNRQTDGTPSTQNRQTDGTPSTLTLDIIDKESNRNIENKNNSSLEKNKKNEVQNFSLEELAEFAKVHKIPIKPEGIPIFKSFNEKQKYPYFNGQLQMAFEIWLEKKWNKKYKIPVSAPPPSVVTHAPPLPQPKTIAEVANTRQFSQGSAEKWEKVMDALTDEVGLRNKKTFFAPLAVDISPDNKQMAIIATKYLYETIEEKFVEGFKNSLIKTFGQIPNVKYEII